MDALVPIFICAVLPIAIVLIVCLVSINGDNKRANVLIKAIENNNSIDAEKLAAALAKPRKTPREVLNARLLRGCIFAFVGVGLLIVGIVSWCTGAEFQSDPVTVPMVFGGGSLAVGLAFLVTYFVTRKQVKD